MIPTDVHLLRDQILAEARVRGVALEEHSLRLVHGLPVLRFRLGRAVLRRCHVRLPGARDMPYAPDVITVHGSGFRASRMWPRRRDLTFNIEGVVTRLLVLVEEEVSRPKVLPRVEVGVPLAASGLHIVHVAGLYFDTLPPTSMPNDVLARVRPRTLRGKLDDHLGRDGLSDADLRLLADESGLFFGRCVKIDFDPFESISDQFLEVFRIGSDPPGPAQQRHVLLLDNQGDEFIVADPAGAGLTTMSLVKLKTAWTRGVLKGISWLGTLSPRGRR